MAKYYGVDKVHTSLEDRMKVVAEALNLPDSLVPFTVIPFGYPKKEKERPDRYEPERVHWID